MKPITIALLTSALIFTASAASAQTLEGTARLHFTTSSGVSNFSGNKTCANSPCPAYAVVSPQVKRRYK